MKLNSELAKVYYTAAEAREVLGIEEETFQYWGRSERIKRIYLPNRKQAVYSRKEVNSIASKMETAVLAENLTGLTYRQATINDLDSEVELAHIVFGARASNAEMIALRRSFMKKNPNTTYHLYEGDYLVAYINIIPFDQDAIEKFKEGQRGWLLGEEHIEQFQSGKPLECIIIDMATTPTAPPARRSTYAQMLLNGLTITLSSWGKRGIEISKVYAASNTASGIRILKHAGFQDIKDMGNGRYVFELDIETSETKILLEYKEANRQWKEQQNVPPANLPKRQRVKPENPNKKMAAG